MKGITPKEFINKINNFQKGLSFETKEILECMNDAHADYVRRIFVNGRNGNLQKIGQYSTKPMLIGRKTFDGLKSTYKIRKDAEWRTVNTRKGKRRLAVLQGGYKEFRQITGRQTATVDLRLRGTLYTDVANGVPRRSMNVASYKLQKRNKFVVFSGVSNEENSRKLQGHIERYGDVTFKADKVMLRNLGKCLAFNSVKLLLK